MALRRFTCLAALVALPWGVAFAAPRVLVADGRPDMSLAEPPVEAPGAPADAGAPPIDGGAPAAQPESPPGDEPPVDAGAAPDEPADAGEALADAGALPDEPAEPPPAAAPSAEPGSPAAPAAISPSPPSGETARAEAEAQPAAGSAARAVQDVEPDDRFVVQVSSDTVVRLFRRTPLPGAAGTIVEQQFAAPLYEYATLRIRNVDVPWEADSIDIELSGWGNVNMAEAGERQRVDGDLAVASVRHRFGPAYVLLGRHVRTGGAARFARIDGLTAGVRAPFGLGVDGYGGFAVLPRWSERPGYHLLGSAADTLLRSPEAWEDPSREDHWLAGGRLYYAHEWLGELGASYHEQHEDGGLGRRSLGVDLRATPHEVVAISGETVIGGDSWLVSDARAAVDVYPLEELALSAEYQHTVPSLFLSRQSVLSVFSVDGFHEIGGTASYQPLRWLEVAGGGYADVFSEDGVGMRLIAQARLLPLPSDRLVVRLGYRRVGELANGYHAARLAAGYRVIDAVRLTAESSWYLYDEPVRHRLSVAVADTELSWVAAGHAQWAFHEWLSALLGGSVGSTPYATFDAQALARLRMDMRWEP